MIEKNDKSPQLDQKTSIPKTKSNNNFYKGISPVKSQDGHDRWDGTFTGFSNVLLYLDHHTCTTELQPSGAEVTKHKKNSHVTKRDFIFDCKYMSKCCLKMNFVNRQEKKIKKK